MPQLMPMFWVVSSIVSSLIFMSLIVVFSLIFVYMTVYLGADKVSVDNKWCW